MFLCFTALTFASSNVAARPGGLWMNAAGILFIILLGVEGRLICMSRQLVKLKEVLREPTGKPPAF